MTIFCERLTELMQLHAMTQGQLAKKTGLTQQAISRYLHDERTPNINALEKLCLCFEVSADYLIGLENEDGSKKY